MRHSPHGHGTWDDPPERLSTSHTPAGWEQATEERTRKRSIAVDPASDLECRSLRKFRHERLCHLECRTPRLGRELRHDHGEYRTG